MILVIAIVSVLIGIIVPAIGAARASAQSARTQSVLRSHGTTFMLYMGDYDDMYPYITSPGVENIIDVPGMGTLDNVFFFEAHTSWHLVLAGTYTSEPFTSDIFFPVDKGDGDPPGRPLRTNIHYPCAFIARPGFWRPETRSIPGQFAPTRGGEVLFPSSKSLLVLSWPFVERVAESGGQADQSILITLCDGSVREVDAVERLHGYWRGDGAEFVNDGAVHFTDFPPLLHTIGGVRGRDIRGN